MAPPVLVEEVGVSKEDCRFKSGLHLRSSDQMRERFNEIIVRFWFQLRARNNRRLY